MRRKGKGRGERIYREGEESGEDIGSKREKDRRVEIGKSVEKRWGK